MYKRWEKHWWAQYFESIFADKPHAGRLCDSLESRAWKNAQYSSNIKQSGYQMKVAAFYQRATSPVKEPQHT